ncbi:uncharacterized protein LOC110251656 [Exaiptasia diaphana]|uniref:Uncharacterized protein n=1 Tax=Exaiptasia diaphana TaxID=2652724 RepID=A0A913Y3V4_EXADI|nr:uncharacterized protein LOC110243475 [Exaiptasia diaphana]XP_020914044.1 uncharacterized protein LOC110251656 [Exaiptasia diaphana]KXJ22885.1 hypothetical protein AC249_AIPGENE26245 [Exaiptasia diaphana]KXJ25867.1 hypothetical protein AC249_AIPGENE27612 [Exaiptasia diaphana]
MHLRVFSFLLCLTVMILHYGQGVKGHCRRRWVKMNSHAVCFGARGNKYGSFHNYAKQGMVAAIKLVYLRGYIRCDNNAVHNSRWGCGRHRGLAKIPLNVIGTDQNNHVLFPRKELWRWSTKWYNLPFADTIYSRELVFTDYAHPFYFPLYKQMRIWYGEDLSNLSESDNHGRVCVNVYAKFID